MKHTLLAVAAPLLCLGQAVHQIRPGDNPQAVADRARAGDRLVFLPGEHLAHVGKYRSMLYIDKPLDVELSAGATLKLAPGESKLEKTPEITTDHGAPKTIDDFEVGGEYDLGLGEVIYTISIDSTGRDGAPDTFRWGSGALFNYTNTKIPITGDWQTLSNGVKIRFPNKSGHSTGSLWFISYDGPEAYGIRVGHGTQKEYIDGVRIYGKGTIDLNSPNNAQPSGLVKDINACVLVHGRVRNVLIEGITMRNTMRSVMLYGEHTGKFLQGGKSGAGESFDAEDITIQFTRTENPKGSGYLLGHPSHRGWLRKVRCNYNSMETDTTSIEPNFHLDQYEVIGNIIKSNGRAIHCWRRSTNGLVKDNLRIDDTSGKEVVMVNAPGAWENPEGIVVRDNRNLLSEPVGFWAHVAGGQDNRATGRFATVWGGAANTAAGDYSVAGGLNARATRTGELAQASGMFQSAGDAQTSQLVARAQTTSTQPAPLILNGRTQLTVPAGASAAYRILAVARSEDGTHAAAFEAKGLAQHTAGQGLKLLGATVSPIHRTAPELDYRISADGEAIRMEAQGVNGATIRWVARVELSEVRF